MECPECYGNWATEKTSCRQCEFHISCRYYTKSEKQINSRSERNRAVNLDKINHIAARKQHTTENTSGNDPIVFALSRFFRYLLALDSYTLGIISQVMESSARGENCSVKHLSELRGCSRQAIHRKLLNIIARNPELAGVFSSVMNRVDSGRRLFNAGRKHIDGV